MADEFHASGNWWDASSRNRYESGTPSSSSSGLSSLGNFCGWLPDVGDIKGRSSMESVSVSSGSSVVFQETAQKLQPHNSAVLGESSAASSLVDPNLHMMNLGLSTQAMDWNNQALLRGDKSESSFRSMLQENLNMNANSFQEETTTGSTGVNSQIQWRPSEKIYSGASQSGININDGDHSSVVTCQGLTSAGFHHHHHHHHQQHQMDSSAMYGSPSSFLQGVLSTGSESQQQQQQQHFDGRSSVSANYPSYPTNYAQSSNDLLPPSNWSSNKLPQFLRISPPKAHHQPPPQPPHDSQLHFSNNAPFWNASAAMAANDIRSATTTYFPPSTQTQFPTPTFDEKPKNISDVANPSTVTKKSSGSISETAGKRPRNETPSPLPAFKVKKEKMGDRITALQQLVSPFGKTDTASVLTEVIESIKFLHEQVNALSAPYMKGGAAIQNQQNPDKSEDHEGPRQDLRSRGLCLVPVSSTYPVTQETMVEFWTPTFGGTFR